MEKRNIVIVDGCRTPFLRSGTDYMDLMSYQLGAFAIKGLLTKTGIPPSEVDSVIMGTVISNIKTSNVARESALSAGVPSNVPCHTVTQACISANRAVAAGVGEILAGQADVVIAGGTESTSDTPIGFNKAMRKKLFKAQKIRGFGDMLKFVFSLRVRDIFPERPAVAEYSTNRTMGQDCEILAARYSISRQAQDVFAVRSHQLTAKAYTDGLLQAEMTTVSVPPKFKNIDVDNGFRGDSTEEKAAKLRPAFDKKYGTLTAANSSFLTDGASAILMMTEEKATALGMAPKARIVDYAFSGQDLDEELLLGNAYAVHKVLEQTNLKLADMDVIEFHEAFSGQILANLACLASIDFCREKLGRHEAIGQINMAKFNTLGGSLAIGHPFAATGTRLITTAANRLQREGGKYALLAACAAGAHGHAMIIERYES